MELLTQKTGKRIFSQKSVFTILLALVTVLACEVEEPVPTYTLNTSVTPSEGGKISVSPQESNYVEGSQVTLTPEPNDNWVFKQWEGDVTGSTTPLQLTMTANKSVVGVFVKRDYPLNITIEGEGSVEEKIVPNPSGREYPHGTTVELTPKPKEGWEFESWSGDLTGNENPKIITVDKEKNVTAKFKEFSSYKINRLRFGQEYSSSFKNLDCTFFNPCANFHYTVGGSEYFMLPGTTPTAGPPTPSITLKKVNGKWELHKIHNDALMNQPRNFKLLNANEFVIGDSNEHGSGPWRGNMWYGKIKSDGDINWKKINSEADKAYYHGVTGGDLNNDGLWDFGGVPADPEYKIFIQEQDGSFKKNNDLWKLDLIFDSNNNQIVGPPFTINFENVFGDSRDEIITADYGGGYLSDSNPHINHIGVYKINELTGKYELHFKSSEPNILPFGLGATSILVADFNKDNKMDIAVAREDTMIDKVNSIEVWLGNGDGTFYSSFSKMWKTSELQFREFSVLDADQDGYPDIVLRANGGKKYWTGEINPAGDPWPDGINLNSSILINKGDGTFSPYSKRQFTYKLSEGYGSVPMKINPFLRDGKLCFLGTQPHLNDYQKDGFYDVDIIEICLDLR